MDHFPLFAKLRDRRCLVVGGGDVAGRKVRALRAAGARVTVNAPELNTGLSKLAADGDIEHAAGAYDPALIEDHLLIIAATSDPAVNIAVAADAAKANRLCNVVDDGEHSGFIMPSVVDRSPVVIAVSTDGQSPVLARLLRQRLDDWLPSRIGDLAAWAGKWRGRVADRFGSHAERLRFWERVLDGDIGQRVLDGDRSAADRVMIRELAADGTITSASISQGEAWIVGAGPGDPGLITRRGLECLQRADVVLHDRLIADELLAYARRDAEFVYVGKQAGMPSTPQMEINARLIALVSEGKRVCRLKGGDPFVFGRGGEEIQALAEAGLPFEVVPGISAANGCAASAGIPLTHRGVSGAVTFVTGHRASGHEDSEHEDRDWEHLAKLRHTLAIYMSAQRIGPVCERLVTHGRAPATPAALVIDGTTERQRVIGGTLADIASRAANSAPTGPGLLIVGDVVELADKLEWLDHEQTLEYKEQEK
jgi:uroporphyrin-III C-methyltransferase/precorrin-2 dehydrogenase/sirohydrochlorin ferrochelatase